jgi:hypothetical protein
MSPTLSDYKSARSNSVDGLGIAQQPADRRPRAGTSGGSPDTSSDESKWIHRDKLAKIESQELQAAGIFIPRARAPSKQRRDRSQSRLRHGADGTESRSRSRKNSTADYRPTEPSAPSWDLRTPEEIAEEERKAYFASINGKGGSRIPVAKTSPAPIPMDYLDRSSGRKQSESPDEESLAYSKTRARSASGGARELDPAYVAGKRSVTDSSPRKTPAGSRKSSTQSKAASAGRPRTRGGRDTSATRPSTRSGELNKQPEGDPPWMINSYKPDPRLPPDQQLLPTVARRLQQEKWEKEGKFGDVYDKDFRPLNDNAFLRPPESEKMAGEEAQDNQDATADEWPLKPDMARKSPEPPKSPATRPGSYSTMPKISDKTSLSPQPSPLATSAPQLPRPQQQERPEQPPQSGPEKEEEKEEKGGCGCCVVM